MLENKLFWVLIGLNLLVWTFVVIQFFSLQISIHGSCQSFSLTDCQNWGYILNG